MASVKRRPDGKWRARYRDDSGKEHARHFSRKVDAQTWLDQVTASVVRGDYVDPKAGRITVASYARSWEAVQVSSEGTKRIVDNALRLHLVPSLGVYPLAAVRPTMVQGFIRELEAKPNLGAGSIRNIYDVTARLFAAAVDDRLIARTPCVKIKLPKGDGDEVIPPTVHQVSAIADAVPGRWRALVVLLAGAGLRIGEARGLEVGDVDFLRRTVRVERQRLQSGVVAPLKSKASRRAVPVGRVVIDELAAHLSVYPTRGPLFVDELGEPLPYSTWKKILAAAVTDANVTDAKALRELDPKAVHEAWDLTSHSFRHFAASALIAGGASVKQVQTFLGHASAVITLRTYAHMWPGDEDRTRNVLDAALSPLADSLRTEGASNG